VRLCDCILQYVSEDQRVCPSPNDDVKRNEGSRLSSQSSGVTRVAHQPACFTACDASFLPVEWSV